MVNINDLVSPNLRNALREHGWAKLAFAVVHAKGGYPPEEATLPEVVKALGMKLAVDKVNQAIIDDGIVAYKALHE